MADNKHLTLEDRVIIEKALSNGASLKAIADTLDKDKSTILREIKGHVKWRKLSGYGRGSGTYDCRHLAECGTSKSYCAFPCDKRERIACKRKDKVSGVCNGCDGFRSCKLDKKIYEPILAHREYIETLHESREGRDITYSEAEKLAGILKPLLDSGQSLAVIKRNHPEIKYSEKTLYNFIEDGLFSPFGINNLSLRLKVKRKMPKTKETLYKKREDRRYLKGRTCKDFENYIAAHQDKDIVEMDTVYNDVSDGPFIEAFFLVRYHIMIAIYHEERTAEAMYQGVKKIHDLLGDKLFSKCFSIILTDRGAEFTKAEEIEALGCKVFYCDPMASWQKPHVESSHRLLRCVLPKKADLGKLGLRSQADLDLIMSHIDSYRRESLSGRSPIEVFKFFNVGSDLLERLGLKEIDPDDVVLTPGLIKK